MAITTLEQNTVFNGARVARKLVNELYPIMQQLNVTYDSVGGIKDTLTQAELDSVSALSGITKQQVDDGMFVITSTLRTAISTAYSQLQVLASRSDNQPIG